MILSENNNNTFFVSLVLLISAFSASKHTFCTHLNNFYVQYFNIKFRDKNFMLTPVNEGFMIHSIVLICFRHLQANILTTHRKDSHFYISLFYHVDC